MFNILYIIESNLIKLEDLNPSRTKNLALLGEFNNKVSDFVYPTKYNYIYYYSSILKKQHDKITEKMARKLIKRYG